jgi:hypothetical protein
MDDDDRTGEAAVRRCREESRREKQRRQSESRVSGFYSRVSLMLCLLIFFDLVWASMTDRLLLFFSITTLLFP